MIRLSTIANHYAAQESKRTGQTVSPAELAIADRGLFKDYVSDGRGGATLGGMKRALVVRDDQSPRVEENGSGSRSSTHVNRVEAAFANDSALPDSEALTDTPLRPDGSGREHLHN